ncbi:hypothetical protein GCM10010967_34950 [Dyadobacter beijingensis]|uniref:Secretion system C-terminal sorting domain-containing protein n=1 Tax=Dyadobacter beijingensis TaxID=365489 RepID=A0ABQ2I326_9BACT|nr:FG-GAP-like repeat-containing protein [Dyadobacter beijingensis]GGM98143.1 hypothetical protein GCM10010967_34950 [Dyadobacter beijingensis]
MKTLHRLSILLAVIAFCAYPVIRKGFQAKNRKPEKSPDMNALPVSENLIGNIRSTLGKQEYNISYDPQSQTLQSPNRAHNLRASYKPGKFSIRNRIDSAGHNFNLDLIHQGIFADGELLHKTSSAGATEQRDNTLRIHHDGFKEEFINNEDGVRQNFIIESAPSGTKELTVRLQAHGLKARQGEANEIRFYSHSKHGKIEDHLVYNDLHCWDANQKPLLASLELTGNDIAIRVDVEHATYPVTIDPIVSNGNPNNADKVIDINQGNAWLGLSVASAGDVNGDGYSDIIVGAPKYDNGQADEGAAFVFNGTANGLSLAGATLEGNQAGAQAGYAVATAGDFNGDGYSDVLVGVPYYDALFSNEGVVLLYLGSANGIKSNQLPFKNLTGGQQADANWGVSVATAGDVNADGLSDILYGAHEYDNGQHNEGAVMLVYGAVSGIGSNVFLEYNQPDALFGYAIAPAGDINADGYSDILIGARFYDNGEDAEGAAFIYKGGANGLDTSSPIVLESNQPDARMGHSLSSAGDVNGDGYSDIAIGIYMYDNGQANEGAVWVYHGTAAGVGNLPNSTLEVNQTEAQYGWAVNCAGDVNGDGYSDLVVGARYFDKGQNNEGAAFIHHGSANGLLSTPAATIESDQSDAWLGSSVASAGDVNGDGHSDIIVGAYAFDNGQADEGLVLVYHGGPTGVGTAGFTQILGSEAFGQLGCAVASAGDVNGDGYDDVIVGANYYDMGQVDEGLAFLYYGSAAGLNTNTAVILQENKAGARFGAAVAGAGDVNGDGYADVIVGADTYANGQAYEGAVFIYHGSAAGLSTQAAIHFERNFADSYMGGSVACAGDVNRDGYADVIVGADGVNSAYVYKGSANGLTGNPTILQILNQPDARFGGCVASAGDVNGDGYADVIVGADWYDEGQTDEGAAFIFHGSAAGTSTNAAVKFQSNQTNALMGRSVAGAGDINGDGYADVLVSAPDYDKGESNEGIIYIHYGASGGITNATPFEILEINKIDAYFGENAQTAGDVNGDGYSDIIASTANFTDGQQHEGSAFVFHGSSTGIKPAAAFSIQSDINEARLGSDAATAGDINGDGYSDVIIGASGYPNGQKKTGSTFVYYGNNSKGLRNSVRLLNSNLVSPLSHSQFNQPNFVAGLFAKSFIGRNKGKLVWETRGQGMPFSKTANNPITTSTQFTGATPSFSNTTGAATLLGNLVDKAGLTTKLRVRARYAPALAITGQVYGPWRYVQSQLAGFNNAPVPEEVTENTSDAQRPVSQLEDGASAFVAYPNPVADRLFIKIPDPGQLESIYLVNAAGRILRSYPKAVGEVDVSDLKTGAYLLVITNRDGSTSSRKVIVKR